MEDYYRKRYESLLVGFNALQRELEQVKAERATLLLEKVQWVAEKEKQTRVIFQTVTEVNQRNNEYLEENRRLKEELNQLKAQ